MALHRKVLCDYCNCHCRLFKYILYPTYKCCKRNMWAESDSWNTICHSKTYSWKTGWTCAIAVVFPLLCLFIFLSGDHSSNYIYEMVMSARNLKIKVPWRWDYYSLHCFTYTTSRAPLPVNLRFFQPQPLLNIWDRTRKSWCLQIFSVL